MSDLAPLKGEKESLHEVGMRVPQIVKHPKMIKKAPPAPSSPFLMTFIVLSWRLQEARFLRTRPITFKILFLCYKTQKPNLRTKQSIGITPTTIMTILPLPFVNATGN